MPLISIVSPFSPPWTRFRIVLPEMNRTQTVLLAALACALAAIASDRARAASCSFEAQGEGRVASIIDARSFRLTDGREIKLAGIEPVSADAAKRTAAVSALVAGRDV